MTQNDNLKDLMKIKDRLENEETSLAIQDSRIVSPAKEVEGALTTFITSQINRIERDSQFGDLIKMQLRGRFSEFTIDQLLELNNQVSRNNTKNVEAIIPLMVGDAGGKTTFEHLRDTSVDTAAQNLYKTADKDMLQAISYLSSIMSRFGQQTSPEVIVGDAELTN